LPLSEGYGVFAWIATRAMRPCFHPCSDVEAKKLLHCDSFPRGPRGVMLSCEFTMALDPKPRKLSSTIGLSAKWAGPQQQANTNDDA
jgi:hypothetical protein